MEHSVVSERSHKDFYEELKVRIKKLQTELKSRFKEIQDLKDDGKKILWDRYNGEDCISAIEELDALASDISDLYGCR